MARGRWLVALLFAVGLMASSAVAQTMGVTSVVSDQDGRFGISLRRAGWPTAIVAAKAGFGPARLEVPKNGGKQLGDWPNELVLRLGAAPQTVHGRVLDQDGATPLQPSPRLCSDRGKGRVRGTETRPIGTRLTRARASDGSHSRRHRLSNRLPPSRSTQAPWPPLPQPADRS